MTKSIVVKNQGQSEHDMFADLEPLSLLEVKKDYVATQLTALMIHCGKTRSEMAEELGWQKSRVTKVLSGHNNLTLKSICEFSTHLGYDFDVVFHSDKQRRPMQPWQIHETRKSNFPIERLQTLNLPIKTQSLFEVAVDILSGNGKPNYWSFDTQALWGSKMVDLTKGDLPLSMKTDPISTGIEIPVMQTN